jgi:hypothetical protein
MSNAPIVIGKRSTKNACGYFVTNSVNKTFFPLLLIVWFMIYGLVDRGSMCIEK